MSIWPGVSWLAIKARIAKEFPDVKSISTAELAKRLAAKGDKPVLLDVRTAAEFDVSRLAGAQRVEPDAATVALPKDAVIVTYCSVGYRSAKFAQRLQAAGFTNVRNLDGSIFQWANEGRPTEPSAKVHPFNKKWGALLDSARRAE
ncbi:MAG: rhodanese-like domain-containing protein [Chthoniobacteraceae bacterium]